MNKSLVVFILIFSHLSAHALTITSGVTTVVGRSNIANRQFEASKSGMAMEIWTDSSFSTQVQAAYFNGSSWLPPIEVATGTFPQVGVASNGVSHAVWLNYLNTSSTQIFTSRFNPSSNLWSAPIQLSNTGINSAPQIAVNSQGNALVVWIQSYPSSIQASTHNASNSTWSGPITLFSGTVTSPLVSLDDSNNGIVTWLGGNFNIEAVTVRVPSTP